MPDSSIISTYCDLCSRKIDQPEQARELMLSGTCFKFCCQTCESAFLDHNASYEIPNAFAVPSVGPTHPIYAWLQEAVCQKASDIFLSVGEPPTLKIFGTFKKLSAHLLNHQILEDFIKNILPENKLKQFYTGEDVDAGFEIKGISRFRLNIYRHNKGLSIAIRPLPYQLYSLAELGLPEIFYELTRLKHGLILVTGPAGSGKTTTLASFIHSINQKDERHIITIEDPIEYIVPNRRCLIHQREVGWHTSSFSNGLRSALRENPDIIVVGELRDLESISLALRAAETGHLVLGTLHSGSAVQTLTRIIDVFDSVRQSQVMIQLAQSLQCICSQKLIKRADHGGMVLATEILMVTLAISNIIRQNRIHEIRGYMETGQAENMHTFKQSIERLVQLGLIEEEEPSEITEILDTKLGLKDI